MRNGRKRIRLPGALVTVMICLCLVVCASAETAEQAQAAGGGSMMDSVIRMIWPEEESGSWTMRLGIEAQAWPPYGEKRIEQLNALIQHLGLTIRKNGEVAQIEVTIDGKETPARMTVKTEETAPETKETDTAETGEAESAETGGAEAAASPDAAEKGGKGTAEADDAGDTETDPYGVLKYAESADQAHAVWQMLEEGAELIRKIPELIPESCAEKKVKQKLKTGVAVRSVTVSIQPAEEGEHPLLTLIRNAEESLVRETMKDWEFRGRQRFTLLYDAEGRLLKANYSGRAGESSEQLRNITLEWRLLRTDTEKRDEVTLRTPTVQGSNRDNWIISREWKKGEEGETLTFSFESDRKAGNSKVQTKWEGNLSGGERLSGEVSRTRKEKNETDKMVLRPDWALQSEKQFSGTLEIIHVSDKIEQEHATLTIAWSAEESGEAAEYPAEETEPDKDGSGERTDEAELTEEEKATTETGLKNQSEPTEEDMTAALLRSILTMIPEEDLGFLKEDIPEKDWQRIMTEAGKGD